MNTDKKNKVLMIGPLPPPVSGQSLSFKLLIDLFSNKNLPISFVDTSRKSLSRTRDQSFTLRRAFQTFRIILKGLVHISNIKVKTVYLTLTQSNLGFIKDFVFINFAKLLRKTFVIHLKGGNYDKFYDSGGTLLKRLIASTMNRVDHIIILSHRLENVFYFIHNQSKIVEIHNTAPEFDDSQRITHKQVSPGETLKLLYLSNIVPSKGIFELLDAAAMLLEKSVSFELHIAGNFLLNSDSELLTLDSLKKKFHKKLARLGDRAFFYSHADKELKTRLMSNCHVFVLPTYYNNEGQPVSIIEALYHGMAILSTHYRSIPDMLEDGENGYFLKEKNAADIACVIEKLYNQKSLIQSFSKKSIEFYYEKFSRDRHLANMESLLFDGKS